MMTSRFAWQDRFIEAWERHSEPNFFLCALPGGGKTRAARRAARLWIEQGGVVVIVSPSLPIKRHWRTEFRADGLNLDENFYGYVRLTYCGITTTYHALKTQCSAFRKLCSDKPVLVICDEIHHASEDDTSSWGINLREAFSAAQRRLLLSGTPVRSDKETTSFLRIEDFIDDEGQASHRYQMHECYDWPEALQDRVVRTLVFPRVKMESVDVQFEKGVKTFLNNEDGFLGYALDHQPFLHQILKQANDRLSEWRRDDATAGALAIAKNITHAKDIVKALQLLGEKPIIVTTDEDEDTIKTIDEFKVSDRRWLVSVRQVSEGVDIPRLRVLAYLTNYLTELFFRQAIGRVCRRRETESDSDAIGNVFIPEYAPLIKFAEKIEKLQALALQTREELNGRKDGKKPDRGITIGGAAGEFIGYIIHGQHFDGDQATVIHTLMAQYRISEESASLMLNDPNFASGIKLGESPKEFSISSDHPPWVQEEMGRNDCNNLVAQLAQIRRKTRGLGSSYDRNVWQRLVAQIHGEFMVDGTPQAQMTSAQLQIKKEQLRQAIFNENRPQ